MFDPAAVALEDAIAALEAADEETALEELAAAWRELRAKELVTVIDRLAERVEARVEPLRGRSSDDRYRAFMETVAGGHQRDLGRLIKLLEKLDWSDTKTALDELLYQWPHSPRIATLLEHGRIGARDRVAEILMMHAQPRSTALSDQTRRQLAEIERLLARGEVSGESLLEAIYANPRDDGPRSIYADWLQTRGDLRGEFIALQLARHAGRGTAASVRRERTLLAAHRTQWLGPLAEVVVAESAVFARGFAAAVKLRRLDPLTAREWATIEAIELGREIQDRETIEALVRLPALDELRGLSHDLFGLIARRIAARHLGLAGVGALPSAIEVEPHAGLRSLGLYDVPATWSQLLRGATSLERIELTSWTAPGPWLLRETIPARVREVVMTRYDWRLRFQRSPTNDFDRATASSPTIKDFTNMLLRALEDVRIRELEIVVPRTIPTTTRATFDRRVRLEHPELETIRVTIALVI